MNLINEDCLTGIKNVEDNSVDLVFCDLPYGCTSNKWDEKLDLDKLATELWRVAKDYCSIIFTCKFKFGLEIIKAMGEKYFRYDMVWRKNRPCGYLNSNRMPMIYHENILVFYKKCPSHIYKNNKQKYHKRGIETVIRNSTVSDSCYGKVKGAMRAYYKPRLPNSILDFTLHNNGLINSTQKPVQLIEFFIKYYTEDNALVLDPTFGSGTTALACQNLKRDFIGFEKDEAQYKKALERLKV